MATVSYAHIEYNAQGEPIVAPTRIKVRRIALDRIVHGWDADEIRKHHPDLTLGQIHSALAYYFDHKEEMDRDIAVRHDRVTELRAAQGESPGRGKLRGRGLPPRVRDCPACRCNVGRSVTDILTPLRVGI